MLKRRWKLLLFAAIAGCIGGVPFFSVLARDADKAEPEVGEDAGQVAISVGRLLEQGHFSRVPLGEDVSKKLFSNYLDSLDFNHMYFTEKDVAELEGRYASSLDDYLLLGNPKPAYEIYDKFLERVSARVQKIEASLKSELKFDGDESVQISRQKLPWPKDMAEADALWVDRLRGEVLQEILTKARLEEKAAASKKSKTQESNAAGTKEPASPEEISPEKQTASAKIVDPAEDLDSDPPTEIVRKRYSTFLQNLQSQDRRDVLNGFLSSLAQTYDPHSEYMGPAELENFEINMRLSLVGIGAVLKSDEGYAKIMDLIAGGPAEADGRLKVNDRIAGVAQGKDGEFVDTVGMKLDKVVQMIRGDKGTTVRLKVLPGSPAVGQGQSTIDLVRNEIKLTDQQAKAEIIERVGQDGRTERLGWITLPSFYADMSRVRSKEAKSTTRDVERLIARLKKEGVKGLVLDLRRNGGGSLEEAVNLTGLFIKNGPVVQAKDSSGNLTVQRDRDPGIAWEGPLVVLTSRLSASASEILAGALQDYGRAVIVGDESTFGKGTVQTMLDISKFMPLTGGEADKAGALKLTIQQFYRVSGASTQLKGVESDIHLPAMTDNPEIGESSLKHPLPFDQIDAQRIEPWESPLFLAELKQRSAERVAKSREFQYVEEDFARLAARLERNTLSLNEKVRLAEIQEEKDRRAAREEERKVRGQSKEKVYELTLEAVDAPELKLASEEKKPEANGDAGGSEEFDEPMVDAERDETLSILSDLVELESAPQTASVEKR